MFSKQKRENLDIIFRMTSPGLTLQTITDYIYNLKEVDMSVRVDGYSEEAYDHFGQLNLKNYSIDETKIRYSALRREIESYGSAYVFGMLSSYAGEVLDITDGKIVCKMEEILNWNSICSRLGQDIFTTSWMAKIDSVNHVRGKFKFDWPSVLKTDDFKLNNILKEGVAENHYHLHGSTQSFSLSWMFLMNYPEKIREIYWKNKKLNTRYVVRISEDNNDKNFNATEMLVYASYIRALLFCRLVEQHSESKNGEEYKKFDKLDLIEKETKARNLVRKLRYIYGHSFELMNKKKKCLDYAICDELYYVDSDLSIRLLCGERAFLYSCFKLVYENKMSLLELMMLYSYLVIKSNFRGELIQINNRTGFQNFSKYQDRKNIIFGDNQEYWEESIRLSVVNAFYENNLKALEARIMPKGSPEEMNIEIRRYDKMVKSAGLKDMSNFYYITHFAKGSITNDNQKLKDKVLLPRNHKVRTRVEKQAKALKSYFAGYYAITLEEHKDNLNNEKILKNRICAIDACSNEIGCRPEVFATAFRYLRHLEIKPDEIQGQLVSPSKDIKVTYHAGEDFLDICDGLRAIDESVNFLKMKKGDRLGHALALGINSEEYYIFKNLEIYMTKQDILDNYIWILYRSLEWNIEIDSNNREKLKKKARQLIQEIFELDSIINIDNESELLKDYGNILQLYYESWLLRGDAPELYKDGGFRELSNAVIPNDYTEYMIGDKKLNIYRNNKMTAYLYSMYHYDRGVEERGLESEWFHVEKWYIDLMEKFQDYLMKDIAKRGISIECNPTSNLLIGSFTQYYKHPITRFNNFGLEENCKKVQLEVSINTDDLGVFDTSIENEYALLLNALCRQRHSEGNYNDEEVYAYFDHVRKKSLQMSFIELDKK